MLHFPSNKTGKLNLVDYKIVPILPLGTNKRDGKVKRIPFYLTLLDILHIR